MKLILCSLSIALLSVVPGWSQTSTGAVSGTARDRTGAVIPGAAVTLVSTATNVRSTTTTNETGFYRFPGVVPGSYRIAFEFAGMQQFDGNFTVQVGQSVVVDATMEPSGTATAVEVKEIATLVQTDNPTVGKAMERTRIEQLPINGRSIVTLMQQIPGMESQRAYGTRHGAIEYVWDGSQEEERRWGNAPQISLEALQEFRVDANAVSAKYSRPTNVILSTKSGTNQIHGTAFETARNNALGVARRRQDFFTQAPPLNRHEFGASIGGPVVIPGVYNGKDRTFWFSSYEARRQSSSSTSSYRVPTEAMRNGDFSDLRDAQGRLITLYDPLTTDSRTFARQPFSYGGRLNVIDPARISPTAKYMFSVTRLPTTNANPLVDANWFGPIPTASKSFNVTQRLDHRFSDKDSFYVRTTAADSFGKNLFTSGQLMLNDVWGREINTEGRQSLGATWVHTFSPRFFNELLVSGRRLAWFGGNWNPDNTNYMELLGTPNPFGITTEAAPQFSSTGLSGYDFRENQFKRHVLNNLTIDSNATGILGRHEFQFGLHYRYDQLNVLPDQIWREGMHNFNTLATALYDPASTPQNPIARPQTGHNLANMFLGYANYQNNQNRRWMYLRGGEYAVYLQDNFRLTSRLTLNFGLRWEYWPTYTEKQNQWSGFNPNTKALVLPSSLDTIYALGNSQPSLVARFQELGLKIETPGQAGLNRSFYTTGKRDFGPRFGLAYRALDGQKAFVIRGGYSLSYFPIPLWTFVDRMIGNTPFSGVYQNSPNDAAQSPDGLPNYYLRAAPGIVMGINSRNAIDVGRVQGVTPGSASASYLGASLPDSRIHTWNITVEKGFASDMVARFRYVGNHGAYLDQYNQYNNSTPDFVWYSTMRQPLPTGAFANVARRPFDQTFWGNILEYRKTGWSNYNGMEFEIERRYSNGLGFQLFYLVGNALGLTTSGNTDTITLQAVNQYLPGAVPADYDQRNRLLNYQRDPSIPKHRVRWNWVVDLPFGRGKTFGGNARGVAEKLIGGWQIAGIGSLNSTYFALPTNHWNITGNPVEIYGYRYPIQNCTSGQCVPGYLWWNGYIPANRINSRDENGRPNGYMGVPADYKPAVTPLIPWGATSLPTNAPANTNLSQFWDTNSVWIPLDNSSVQRIEYNDNLHSWRNQRLPSVRQWGLDASIFKNIRFGDFLNVRLGADWFNVLNRPGNPNSVGGDGMLTTRESGQNARTLQLHARITW